jgi:hypothetical protein
MTRDSFYANYQGVADTHNIIKLSALKQPPGFHAGMLVIRDDDMVEDFNADDRPGFYQSFCQADILLGGGNIAGGVIMHE